MTFAKSSIGNVIRIGELFREIFSDDRSADAADVADVVSAQASESGVGEAATPLSSNNGDVRYAGTDSFEQTTEVVYSKDQTVADEASLVERAKIDPESFGLLYEFYIDKVYTYIYNRVGNTQDAEDLTARTFYRALSRLDSYEDRGFPFSAWLFRIAHNLVANWHRDRSKRKFLSLDRIWSHSGEDELPESKIEQEEKHDALWNAINRLPDDRRNLLIYKFSSRLSNVEIGELMNKSESAIKSLYFRTLASLRSDLESREWEK